MDVKRDLLKELKPLYAPPTKQVVEVDVPPMQYLMIDGKGNPNTAQEYKEAVEALFAAAYAIKFASKKAGIDYGVMPLEGLWWMPREEMGDVFGEVNFAANKDRWLWTMMILQPDHITPEMVAAVIADVRKKKNPPALDKIRLERYHEGLSAQIMHIGLYSEETENIARVHAYISDHGCEPTAKHHEIYLSDPRKAQPDKMKTVIRQPMKKR